MQLNRSGRFLFLLVWYGYAIVVFLWFALHEIFVDRWSWLFIINTVAVYLIVPLPLWGIRPFFTKQKIEWATFFAVVAILLTHFGGRFIPKPLPAANPDAITVATYNLLASNINLDGIEQALIATDADLIAIQELTPVHADLLQERLGDRYPYQYLNPERSVTGMGIISRYPLEILPTPTVMLGPSWIGEPQAVLITVEETAVIVLNFHAIPPTSGFNFDTYHVQARETQAGQLALVAQRRATPLIALGDLNATEQNEAYRILQKTYQDAWREAGWGLGHTWPGLELSYYGVDVPRWLVRIDYVFATSHWQIVNAERTLWDGGADHRPVVATLQLRE